MSLRLCSTPVCPARIHRAVQAAVLTAACAGCATLSPPFDRMKGSQMTVYRLQNYEAPSEPHAPPTGLQLPVQIQQWIQAGASLLPPGLLPPGLIPGTPAGPPVADAPRFHGFRVLDYQPITDASLKSDIVDAFGYRGGFQSSTSNCMYAEFGFAIAQPTAPTPADILVSLSCEQVQAFNFTWPYAATGLTPDTSKRIAAIAQRTFQGR
jgi:hypothetical protein